MVSGHANIHIFLQSRFNDFFRAGIIRRNAFGRIYQNSLFALKRFFPASAEKIGDMRIFFRFSDTQLFQAVFRNPFPQGIGQNIFAKSRGQRQIRFIHRHGSHRDLRNKFSLKTGKFLIKKSMRKLPRPVRPEIEKENSVAVLDGRFFFCQKQMRFYELIGNFFRIGSGQNFFGGRSGIRHAVDQHIPSFFNTFPTLIPIHRIEAPANARQFAAVFIHGA